MQKMKESVMNCNDYQQWINRFIDHEARATESAELFEHLGTCAECRVFYDTIVTLGAELDKIDLSLNESADAQWSPSRQPINRIPEQRRIVPRPSTLAFVIVVMLVVSLLFSVNVTIEKPAQTTPTAEVNQR
jgi:predicted anti-sigma-YlaC factor YlaD